MELMPQGKGSLILGLTYFVSLDLKGINHRLSVERGGQLVKMISEWLSNSSLKRCLYFVFILFFYLSFSLTKALESSRMDGNALELYETMALYLHLDLYLDPIPRQASTSITTEPWECYYLGQIEGMTRRVTYVYQQFVEELSPIGVQQHSSQLMFRRRWSWMSHYYTRAGILRGARYILQGGEVAVFIQIIDRQID